MRHSMDDMSNQLYDPNYGREQLSRIPKFEDEEIYKYSLKQGPKHRWKILGIKIHNVNMNINIHK